MSAPPGHFVQAELRCLVAPTAQGDLVLPTSAVAEVVAHGGEARIRKGSPEWLMGDLKWRDLRVPLIDLGAQAHMPAPAAGTRRPHPYALICFTPSGNQALPYIAFLVAGLPRQARIHREDLVPATNPTARPFLLYALELQGRPAWIPDLDALERQGLVLVGDKEGRHAPDPRNLP
jgi:chemosensory pili system protein ChpC